MNSMAVVLAADSALTRRSSNPNIQHYSNGGNKIFSLSTKKRANIGIMIYNSMDICGAPWELLIKSFRHEYDAQTFKTVQDCSDKFFEFIRKNKTLISNKTKKKTFDVMFEYILSDFSKKNPRHKELKDKLLNNFTTSKENQTELDTNQESHLNELIYNYFTVVKEHNANKSEEEKLEALTKGFCIFIFKTHMNGCFNKVFADLENSYTGIVISGFGAHEEYPAFIETICYGISPYKLVFEGTNQFNIENSCSAYISGFAQNKMLKLLLNRNDENTHKIVLHNICTKVKPILDNLIINEAEKSKIFSNIADTYLQDYQNYTHNNFINPLINSISAMSISELSTLAKTIVELEALNERLSQPTQSVGGPTDIISITKNEGLIWIKRKHYFEKNLNPSYFNT